MNTAEIVSKLAGPAGAKARQAGLASELGQTFAEEGAEAVTNRLARRIEELESAFAAQLDELKQHL